MLFADEVFLRHLASPGAENKWTKVWPPLVFWAVLLQINCMVATCMANVCGQKEEEAFDSEHRADDAMGYSDQRAFKLQMVSRFRKTSRWVSSPVTKDKTMCCTLTMQPTLKLMGDFFISARSNGDTKNQSIVTLVDTLGSPVASVIKSLFDALQDDSHPSWQPLIGGGRTWDAHLYHMAAVPMLIEVGSIIKRFVLSTQRWPWRLAWLVLDDPECEKVVQIQNKTANALFQARPCCLDPFTSSFRARCGTRDRVFDAANIGWLGDVMQQVPLTNIGCELHFASAHMRTSSSHGHPPGPTSFAADHVLAEAKDMLDQGIECGA